MSFFSNLFGAGRFNRAPSRDFRPEDLPATRPRLFLDALRTRWSAMVGMNLFYLLFWLPAVVWSGVNLLTLQSVLTSAAPSAEMADAVSQLALTYLLILWPLVAITGPATAGVSYVFRNWARGEHSFAVSDCVEHARKNWKHALFLSTVTGALPLLTYLLWRFYSGMAASVSSAFLIPQAIVLVAVVVWLLMLEILHTMMVTYRLTLRQLLGNALRLVLGKLPLFLGVRLLTLAVPAVMVIAYLFFPQQAATVLAVGGFYYIAIGLSMNRLVYASMSNALCERYINAKIGAPVNIGMRTQTPPPGEKDGLVEPDRPDGEGEAE